MNQRTVTASVLLGLATLATVSSPASAGFENGNGGDAVVCRDPKGAIVKTETLDLYEARTIYSIDAQWGEAKGEAAKAEVALSRLARFSPKRAARYLGWIQKLLTDPTEARFLPNTVLEDIPDSLHVAFPAGCKVEQVVIQREPPIAGVPRYVVAKDIWDKLDDSSRAALVLHEAIYREAIAYGHKNSVAVRLFNAHIFSTRMNDWTPKAFIDFMVTLPFAETDLQGFTVLTNSVHYSEWYPYPGDTFPAGTVPDSALFVVRENDPTVVGNTTITRGTGTVTFGGKYPDELTGSGLKFATPYAKFEGGGELNFRADGGGGNVFLESILTHSSDQDGFTGTQETGVHVYFQLCKAPSETSILDSIRFNQRGFVQSFAGCFSSFWLYGLDRIEPFHSRKLYFDNSGGFPSDGFIGEVVEGKDAYGIPVFHLSIEDFETNEIGWLTKVRLMEKSGVADNYVFIQNKRIPVDLNATLSFHPGFKLKSVRLGSTQPVELSWPDGTQHIYQPKDWILLNEYGVVIQDR